MENNQEDDSAKDGDDPKVTERQLPAAAKRALAEAKLRRAEADRAKTALPKEINGRQGPEPSRYGDWEKDGIISDF